MKKLRGRVADMRLKTKFLGIHFTSLVAASVIILVSAFFVFHQYEGALYRNTSQMLNMTVDSIENDLYAIEQAGIWTVCSDGVQTALNDTRVDFTDRQPVLLFGQYSQRIYEVLGDYFSKNENIINASIYREGQRFYIGSNFTYRPKEEIEDIDSLAALAHSQNGRALWLPTGREDGSLYYLREIRDIQDMTLKPLGLLLLQVDLGKVVRDRLQNGLNLEYPAQLVIQDQEGTLFYSDMPGDQAQQDAFPRENTYRSATLDGKPYFITYATRSRFGLRYASYLPNEAVVSSLNLLKVAVLAISVLAVVLSLVACSALVSQIIRHFDVLVEKMRLFRRGDLQELGRYSYVGRQDEVGYLHRSFDEMVQDFNSLVEDNYMKQLAIKNAHIRSLQNQINPHFLFNILQTISWKAKAGQGEDISHITGALGKMLRYTLRLQKELEVTACYTSIQKYRYGDRLSVSIDIPEGLMQTVIPPMALQNLVENSIKHGLENMLEPCHIKISGREEMGAVVLAVEDNGPGLDENLLEHAAQETETGMGLGLLNLQQRMRLLLGQEYGVRLHDTGHGALVELVLPGDGNAQEGG